VSHSPGDGGSADSISLVLHSSEVAIVSLVGEHDVVCRQQLRDVLAAAAHRRQHVIVSLADCTFIDSSVIGCLVYGNDLLAGRGGQFTVIAPRHDTPPARVLAMIHIAQIVPVHASLEDALASLGHSIRVRDLRARFGDTDTFAAECSCGWRGEEHMGLLALKRAKAEAIEHDGGRAVRPRRHSVPSMRPA
jgi:anti-anti-sigma factor